MIDKPWLSGEPYYCAFCGAGYGEYIACESTDCQLESKAAAMNRLDDASNSLIAEGQTWIRKDADEWQPIETAPKDGTWILLWDANFQTKHNTPACVGRHNANNVWVNDIHATIKPPTHWLPLPDPPEQSKGGG